MGNAEILSLSFEKLAGELAQMSLPAYRARQLFNWLHVRRVKDFDSMTDMPLTLRAELKQRYILEYPELRREERSQDGTRKLLFAFSDGAKVETVIMDYNHGLSVCLSTQAGCRMGCAFCATGQGGFKRNLSAAEILAQFYEAEHICQKNATHTVLMGMGEPLDNYDNTLAFLRLVIDERGRNLGARGISLSSCGLCDGIDMLAKEKLPITLSISLHAADDATRNRLMPVNRAYGIPRLMRSCRDYAEATGRRISFEYIMIDGVNDSLESAGRLAELIRGIPAHINLIPLNAVEKTGFESSPRQRVEAFSKRLEQRGVNVTVRRRLGADISAACGQLRAKENET